jgi:hypothetical protein
MSDQDKTAKQDNDVEESDKYAEYLEGGYADFLILGDCIYEEDHVRSIPMMQSPEPWPEEEEKTEQ